MTLHVRALEQARDELADAAIYVEEQRQGFGFKLFDEYDDLVRFAVGNPAAGTPVDLPVRLELRRFQMKRFRYAIFTARTDDELIVFAVSHHKRAPGYWARRLDEM